MTPDSRKCLFVVILDGVSYDLAHASGGLDRFDESAPLRTVLGYSVAAQSSILTGVSPAQHGGFCMYYRSDSSFLKWARYWQYLHPGLKWRLGGRVGLQNVLRRIFGISGYFDLYKIPDSLIECFDLYEHTAMYEADSLGEHPTFLQTARQSGYAVKTWDWRDEFEDALDEANAAASSSEADVYLLYTCETDTLLHGSKHDETTIEKLGEYFEKVDKLFEAASASCGDVQMLVLSDHGMKEVKDTVDVMGLLEKIPFKIGKDYMAFYDATMARFWFSSDKCRESIVSALDDIPSIKRLSDQYLKDEGCLFADRRYGEEIFLADPGVVICPSYYGGSPTLGMHGYAPDSQGYDAFVASKNISLQGVSTVCDISNLIVNALNCGKQES
ncbi:hypothetical protein BVX97_00790 [bacterium E08(2017)]|nr:hypothetical protein BVX97_00790 [bacterium E08(2017)]